MHKLLADEPGAKMLLLGNEAIARGAIEAGVAFATTYPGRPLRKFPSTCFRSPIRAISISNTAPMKKSPWKWPPAQPMPGCGPCA
jgi:hypothetical protein